MSYLKQKPWISYLIAAGLLVLATLVSELLFPFVDDDLVLLIYVLFVVLIAILCNREAAIVGSIVSVAVFDFFFIHPALSFIPSDVRAVPVLFLMLAVALIVSELAYRLRHEVLLARQREKGAETLFHLSRDYSSSNTIEELIESAELHLEEIFNCECIVMIPPDIEENYVKAVSGDTVMSEGDALIPSKDRVKRKLSETTGKLRSLTGKFAPIQAEVPRKSQTEEANHRVILPERRLKIRDTIPPSALGAPPPNEQHASASPAHVLLLSKKELEAAQRCFEEKKMVVMERTSDDSKTTRTVFLPLLAVRGMVGVLGLIGQASPKVNVPGRQTFLDIVTNQTALAIERAFLTKATREASVKIERERMLNSLLSSVSHDLRTPLATIMGAATVLRDEPNTEDPSGNVELANSIVEESQRLGRLVANLLDMTRLESGTTELKKDWNSIEDVVGSALTRIEKRVAGRTVELNVPSDLPLLQMDEVLFEQMIYNLIENALKYSRPDDKIRISSWLNQGGNLVVVEIANQGIPIPTETAPKVFEKFYRGTDTKTGAGLGLAICRGIAEAHGGRIWLEPGTDYAVQFRIEIPLPSERPEIPMED